jgi:hypothetical protein
MIVCGLRAAQSILDSAFSQRARSIVAVSPEIADPSGTARA